jgi:hypothetical protein
MTDGDGSHLSKIKLPTVRTVAVLDLFSLLDSSLLHFTLFLRLAGFYFFIFIFIF